MHIFTTELVVVCCISIYVIGETPLFIYILSHYTLVQLRVNGLTQLPTVVAWWWWSLNLPVSSTMP